MKLGAYTACLHDRPLPQALDVLKSNGLASVEVNTGGFIPAPHCHVDLLLASAQARGDYLDVFASRGMELTGLNCNGNPLSPLPGVGPKHADDLRRTIELAGLLGVPRLAIRRGRNRPRCLLLGRVSRRARRGQPGYRGQHRA